MATRAREAELRVRYEKKMDAAAVATAHEPIPCCRLRPLFLYLSRRLFLWPETEKAAAGAERQRAFDDVFFSAGRSLPAFFSGLPPAAPRRAAPRHATPPPVGPRLGPARVVAGALMVRWWFARGSFMGVSINGVACSVERPTVSTCVTLHHWSHRLVSLFLHKSYPKVLS
ncbi:hypothetical protein ABZP36_023046 [Zizania latifolia]